MTFALGVIVAGAILAPHLLDLRGTTPATAATIWLSALLLRALAIAFVAVGAVVLAPQTAVFDAVTHWCWHTVLPLLTTHLPLDGHWVGDAATLIPALVLAVSLVSVSFGLVRAVRSVRSLIRRAAAGVGPENSVLVEGPEVLLAAAGMARPQVLVSAGALLLLDDEELAAGLEHERGHIARRHRFVLLVAELSRSMARFLPGTRTALSELVFHLERDADRWALERRHDPLALASAICKAALSGPPSGVVLAGLGGGSRVRDRLDQLTDGPAFPVSRVRTAALRGLAAGMTALVVVLAVAVPVATAAADGKAGGAQAEHHCER